MNDQREGASKETERNALSLQTLAARTHFRSSHSRTLHQSRQFPVVPRDSPVPRCLKSLPWRRKNALFPDTMSSHLSRLAAAVIGSVLDRVAPRRIASPCHHVAYNPPTLSLARQARLNRDFCFCVMLLCLFRPPSETRESLNHPGQDLRRPGHPGPPRQQMSLLQTPQS